MRTTAKNLLFLRKRYSLKQSEIEAKCGIKQRNWSNWENDGNEPDITNLITISNLFTVPVDWLVKLDLEKNVHLLEKSSPKIEELNCTSESTSISTSIIAKQPESSYSKPPVDIQILKQLQALTGTVEKIAEKLLQ